MPAQPIRVVIVDDQDFVRIGLGTFFDTRNDLELVGSAATGQEAVQLCNLLQPDVVLLDLMLGGQPDGIIAARAIRQSMPHICIIALSSFCSPELVEAVFQAGITSYLFKNVSIDELAEAILAAHNGKAVISPPIALAIDSGARKMQ